MAEKLPIYTRWDQVPANMKTKNVLHKAGLRLANKQPVVAYKAGYRGDLYKLYDTTACLPARPQTEKQLAALAAAQEAQRVKHTCPKCGGPSYQRIGGSRRYPRYVIGVGLCDSCEDDLRVIDDCDEAIGWARKMLAADPASVLILDSETTDLDGEILDLAIIDAAGRVVFQSYFYPRGPISPGAQAIHHITMDRLAYAPTWGDMWPEIHLLLTRAARVIIYNASFDTARMSQSCRLYGLDDTQHFGTTCAMGWYAQFYGDWSDYWGNYKWQRLPGGDHTALGDCRATLALIKRMATARTQEESQHVAN